MENSVLDLKEFLKECKEHIKLLFNKKTMVKEIPNLLTASRLIGAVIVLPLTFMGFLIPAGIVTAGFALTDLFDGLASRVLDAKSEFGRKLDATVDKVFALSILTSAIIVNPFIISLLLGEAVITVINAHSNKKGNIVKTNFFGKFKTLLLFIAAASTLLSPAISLFKTILTPLLLCTLTSQALTSITHIIDYITCEKEKKKSNENTTNITNSSDIDTMDKTYTFQKEYQTIQPELEKQKQKTFKKKI